MDAPDGSTNIDEGFEYTADSLTVTVQKLTELGFDIWLVRDIPTYNYPVPRKLAITQLNGGDVTLIGQPYSDLQEFMKPVDSLFTALVNDTVHVVDLPAVICDALFCGTASNGKSLYRDSNHLSTHGSHHVETAFEPIFRSITAVNPVVD